MYSLPTNQFQTIKVSKLDWLRRCSYHSFGPNPDSWSNLPPKLFQVMDNQMITARPSVLEIQRKSVSYESKKRAWKERKSVNKMAIDQSKMIPL